MSINILKSIDFTLNPDLLYEELHIEKGSQDAQRFMELIDEARQIAKPKAMYREVNIDIKGSDYIIADGIKLESFLLRDNLESAEKFYPYIVTCGREIADWTASLDDMLEQFWMDKIMEAALFAATAAFEKDLADNYGLEMESNMNPGSLEDWPISEQKKLFNLLGDPYKEIGVELTDSYLMLPIKTLCGIRFHSDEKFVNCRLCDRENCQNRRVEYDHRVYQQKYMK